MVERREHFGFALKPREPIVIRRRPRRDGKNRAARLGQGALLHGLLSESDPP